MTAFRPHDFGSERPTRAEALCGFCGRSAAEVCWAFMNGQASHCQGAPTAESTYTTEPPSSAKAGDQ